MKKISAFLIFCLLVPVAQAGLVDNFVPGDLSEYTLTKLLDNYAAEDNISYSDAAGDLRSIYTGTGDGGGGYAEQVAFLRNDYSLGIGETLIADVNGLTPSSNGHTEFGIMVAATATPTPLTRTNYVTMNLRNQGGGQHVASQWAGTGGYQNNVQVNNVGWANVDYLYITKIDADTFETGYSLNGVKTLLRTIDVDSTLIGPAIGFYSDMRIADTIGALDNLRIVPEPATIALLGLGGLLLRRKRN
jgi:hypothetical protein